MLGAGFWKEKEEHRIKKTTRRRIATVAYQDAGFLQCEHYKEKHLKKNTDRQGAGLKEEGSSNGGR